jgi:arylsulfatase A-like enzyme
MGGSALSVVTAAAWFGLVVGFLELGCLVIWQRLAATPVLGALQMNRNFVWMIPIAHLAVFLVGALPAAILALFRPALARRAANLLFWILAVLALALIVKGLHPAAAGLLSAGLGSQVARRIGAETDAFRRVQRISLPVMLGCLGVIGAVSYDRLIVEERRSLASLSGSSPGAPNVLLIVLDTVRADRLSLYGYGRDTTPNLARLGGRGVVFGEARSAAPWTLPSHASLFTGRWPHELNVGDDRPLDGTFPTLAEFLARHGYATAGFVGNTYFCNSWYGLGRGFVHYEDYYEQNIMVSPAEALRCTALGRGLIRLVGTAYNVRPETANTPKNAERVNHDFLAWLEGDRGKAPFFAFLNYIDAHDPYLTPPGFDRHFGVKPESPADVERIRTWHHVGDPKDIPKRDLTMVSDAYDDCLAALDEQLGHLFATLERDGVLDNTLVIVTADHGEGFGEHGLYGHGKSLYRPETRVPLLVFGPPGTRIPQGQFIAEPVSLRDVAATVVERLGLADDSPLPGRSLARFWQPSAAVPATDGPILSEVALKTHVSHRQHRTPAMRGPMASLLLDGKVYIRNATGAEELYDLARDPAETTNLADSEAGQPALDRCRIALDRLVPRPAARR